MKATTPETILSLRGNPASDAEGKTQSARAYKAIRIMILECRLDPGELIDEKKLAAAVGFGRTPVREALQRLAYDRLIVFEAGQIIRVAPIDMKGIRDLYESRLHSERLAARLTLQNLTPELQHEIKHCFDDVPKLMAKGKLEDSIALDFRFHSLIYHGSQNQFLINHLHNLFAHSYRLWFMTHDSDVPAMEKIMRSHEPIIAAIVDRNVKRLDEELSDHIIEAFERVFAWFKGAPLSEDKEISIKTLPKKRDGQSKRGST